MHDHETTNWAEKVAHLKRSGWTVEYKPLPGGLPPWVWRSPDGMSGSNCRSWHPEALPDAVVDHAFRSGLIDFMELAPVDPPARSGGEGEGE